MKRIWVVFDLDHPVAAYESEEMASEHAGQFGGSETLGKCEPQYQDIPLLTEVPTGINCDNTLGDIMPLDEFGWEKWAEFWESAPNRGGVK